MLRNSYISATQLIDTAAKDIGARLPPRWLLRDRERNVPWQSKQVLTREVDAILEIRDPGGISSDIIVEVKTKPVEPRLVAGVASQLKSLSHSRYYEAGRPGATPATMLVSTYLSPLTRERLAEAGISYADSTGNLRFTVDRPAVFIEDPGGRQEPLQRGRSPPLTEGRSRCPRGQRPSGLPDSLRDSSTGC